MRAHEDRMPIPGRGRARDVVPAMRTSAGTTGDSRKRVSRSVARAPCPSTLHGRPLRDAAALRSRPSGTAIPDATPTPARQRIVSSSYRSADRSAGKRPGFRARCRNVACVGHRGLRLLLGLDVGSVDDSTHFACSARMKEPRTPRACWPSGSWPYDAKYLRLSSVLRIAAISRWSRSMIGTRYPRVPRCRSTRCTPKPGGPDSATVRCPAALRAASGSSPQSARILPALTCGGCTLTVPKVRVRRPATKVEHRRRRASVQDVHHLRACLDEELAGQMRRRAAARAQ